MLLPVLAFTISPGWPLRRRLAGLLPLVPVPMFSPGQLRVWSVGSLYQRGPDHIR